VGTDLERARAGRHVPALDGVRGLAILLVLVYHCVLYAGMHPLGEFERAARALGSFGWMGVDLFFVLSGFLITGILLDSKESPNYFRAFYMRRVLRIFPLYFVFLAAFLWVLPLVREMGPGFAQLKDQQAWYWTYLVNVKIALEGWPAYGVLGHFWSLAVEEQFYLVWPFVVYRVADRKLIWICLGCLVLPLLMRIALVMHDHATAGHVLTVTRLDALAMGALLALVVRRPGAFPVRARTLAIVLVSGLVVLAAMFLRYRALWAEIPLVNTVGQSVIAVTAGSLLAAILVGEGPRRLARAFESPVLRMLGKYSYGIYVLHHPVIIFVGQSGWAASEWPMWMGTQLPGLFVASALGVGLSIVAALASWTLLESPLLRLKRRFPYQVETRLSL
jgi:peptidoglycan/LPS O-acetylase OafA/YrhL